MSCGFTGAGSAAFVALTSQAESSSVRRFFFAGCARPLVSFRILTWGISPRRSLSVRTAATVSFLRYLSVGLLGICQEQRLQNLSPPLGFEVPPMNIQADDEADDIFVLALIVSVTRLYAGLLASTRAVATVDDLAIVGNDRDMLPPALDVPGKLIELLALHQREYVRRGMEWQERDDALTHDRTPPGLRVSGVLCTIRIVKSLSLGDAWRGFGHGLQPGAPTPGFLFQVSRLVRAGL
jgi:hypothetical protein